VGEGGETESGREGEKIKRKTETVSGHIFLDIVEAGAMDMLRM
jgi:hypothetical protein